MFLRFLPRLHRIRETLYSVVYFLYGLAGVSLLFFTSPAVADRGPTIYLFWHGFLMVGGTVSLAGAIMRLKFIEMSGIPLLGSAFLAYAVIIIQPLFKGVPVNGPLVGIGAIFLAGSLILTDRALELWGRLQPVDEPPLEETGEDTT